MSKQVRKTARGSDALPLGEEKSGLPYTVAARRERSKELAQKRRTTYKSIMDDLTQVLPFPKDVVSQLDYNSRLRLTLCFFRLKTLMDPEKERRDVKREGESSSGEMDLSNSKSTSNQLVPWNSFQPGLLHGLMTEALDGFLLVTSSDGTVVYLSENVHHHLGIFQSEHIGISIYDIISKEDHQAVHAAIAQAQAKTMSFTSKRGTADISFFCRMKCSRFKVANTVTKSPGFKLVYITGSIKMMRNEYFLVTVVKPVSPPSILEIRMEANMFVTHYDMTLKCVFFDGRLKHLLGYSKSDLEGNCPFELQHHDDTSATAKCSEGIRARGEGLSGYYRFLCQPGYYVWLQTRGTLMHDSRTGKPTYMVCMNYIISKEDGEKDLQIRQAITASANELSEPSPPHHPFPIVEREDGTIVNPLKQQTSWKHKNDVSARDLEVSRESVAVKNETKSPENASTVSSSLSPTSHKGGYDRYASDSGIQSDSTPSLLTSKEDHNLSSTSLHVSSGVGSSPDSRAGSDSFVHLPNPDDFCLPDSTTDLDITQVKDIGFEIPSNDTVGSTNNSRGQIFDAPSSQKSPFSTATAYPPTAQQDLFPGKFDSQSPFPFQHQQGMGNLGYSASNPPQSSQLFSQANGSSNQVQTTNQMQPHPQLQLLPQQQQPFPQAPSSQQSVPHRGELYQLLAPVQQVSQQYSTQQQPLPNQQYSYSVKQLLQSQQQSLHPFGVSVASGVGSSSLPTWSTPEPDLDQESGNGCGPLPQLTGEDLKALDLVEHVFGISETHSHQFQATGNADFINHQQQMLNQPFNSSGATSSNVGCSDYKNMLQY